MVPDMVNQNKTFSFIIKRQATIVFPKDVERTVHVVMPAFFIQKNNVSHVCIKRT